MKCVRLKRDGFITRISDDAARALVLAGDGEYVAKKFWKQQTRSN